MNFSAVILAGGKSSRMGRDKALLTLGGETLLARQIKTLRAAGAREVFISGPSGGHYSSFGPPVLPDRFPEAGPLAGIHAALAAARWPLLLVLAVDLPAMDAAFLGRLAASSAGNRGVIPRVAGRTEPLAAVYSRWSREMAESLLRKDDWSARNFAGRCVDAGLAAFVEVDLKCAPLFENVNSPSDLLKCQQVCPDP